MDKMKVSVIGSGTMGKGIVQTLAQAKCVSSIVWLGRSVDGCSASMNELFL